MPIFQPHLIGARTGLDHFHPYWKEVVDDPWAIKTATQGITLNTLLPPIPNTNRQKFHLSLQHQQEMKKNQSEWEQNGFVEPLPLQHQFNQDFILGNYFIVTQGEKLRPCLDCGDLNNQLEYQHFKMEGISTLKQMILEKDWMMKTDLTKAYHTVPIHPNSRHLLAYITEDGRLFQHRGTPFGPGPIPRTFTKLLKAALEPLRKLGIRLVVYIDDILTLGKTREECLLNTATLRSHLRKLGFLVNFEKSSSNPSQQIEFLGFKIDSLTMLLSLPPKKVHGIKYEARKWLKQKSGTIRQLAQLNGRFAATIQAVLPARLKYRALERAMISALKLSHNNWEATVTLEQEAVGELTWWIEQLNQWNGRPLELKIPDHHFETYMDAAKHGWGIVDGEMRTQGNWTEEERQESSNFKETKTILFAFQVNCKKWSGKTVLIRSDNTTAISYMRKMGGPSQKLTQLATQMWEICLAERITPRFQHIAGKDNSAADTQSRRFTDRSAWKLNPELFKMINRKLGPLKLDLFASRETTQLKDYYSRLPDPEATAVDAFTQVWPKKTGYAFPPWNQVNRVLQVVRRQKIQKLVLITPDWPSQTWYPTLLRMSLQPPIKLFSNPHLLSTLQPINNQINPNRYHHLVWTISNRAWRKGV
jgi:hypothetical protein